MDCSTPGFPFPHYLLDFAQTHVHWVSDAIQPSHLLLPPFLPVLSLSQFLGYFLSLLFESGGQKIGVLFKHQSFNEYSGLISFRMDWLDLLVVQLLSCVQLFATPWTAAHQASRSFTISRSLLKLMSIESVMPSNHLILCHPLLLLPSIFPSIRVFSNESVLRIRWPNYWTLG